ncbi:metallo-beta-lactamase family protein [Metarhizium robertsii]|uniref:Beta-lactamase-like protein n=2 Tax=Metarhizium robertsii TaxID=568076 RepID=E9F8Y8_METRA|nr:Beta-lactamase-like protein [Metarhizium robertsii ARSEF 23]EFY95756.1 Beta-lactamase-like protein [Metarhizium robertsii ARSEF 23]EXU96893.1 metallo-beta-lactamase family protein [Metarhizium robertsii]
MTFTAEKYDPAATASWLICTACGTQFTSSDRSVVKTCHICDDPRQYVPPSGQSFTTHDEVAKKHRNEFTTYAGDERLVSITTTPKFAIGQRAILIRTPRGNILWDCLTLLDPETINHINQLGGLKAIVISHPHYYSTHVQWGQAFNCPVYIASEDKVWTTMDSGHQVLVDHVETKIQDTGAVAIKLGGHFPGSLVLLFDGRLFIADTLMTTPAGMGKWEVDGTGAARAKPPGLNSFSFLWSIPNYIPLSVEELARMWGILKRYEFKSTHGAFLPMDIEDEAVKQRVLDSMQIQAKFMGYAGHAIMNETI